MKLIVNADDFGLSELTNKGIADCINKGMVTSTTIIANGNAFEHCIALAKKQKLDTGIHLNLTHYNSLTGLKLSMSNIWKAMLHMLDKKLVEKEMKAQVEKVLKAGIKPTHLDGHKHIHIFPGVIDATITIAKEYNLNKIRLPLTKKLKFKISKQWLKAFLVNHYARKARKKMEKAGIKTTENFYGMMETGRLTTENLKKVLANIQGKTAELMCHPGYYDKNLDCALKNEREIELRALTGKDAKEMAKGTELISFRSI